MKPIHRLAPTARRTLVLLGLAVLCLTLAACAGAPKKEKSEDKFRAQIKMLCKVMTFVLVRKSVPIIISISVNNVVCLKVS